MINSTAIRTAIAELLEGTIGSVRHMATSEYLSVDSNAFSSWTPTGCSVTANQAYGADGQYTADSVVATPTNSISSNLSAINDNTVVDASIYVWVATGTGTFYISMLLKDGSYSTSDALSATTEKQKFTHSDVDILSGGTTPAMNIVFGSSDTFYLSEAHVTSDDYLFGKNDQWDDAIVESTIEPSDGKLMVNTRYDIRFPSTTQHGSSPVSAIGSHKIDELDIEVELIHKLESNVQESSRDTVRERILYNGDRIIQALHYPNNLDQTSASVATGIVSGMLYGLTHDIDSEYWDENPPRIRSVIRGKAAIHNTQLTS